MGYGLMMRCLLVNASYLFFSDLFTSEGDRDFHEALEVVLPVIEDHENVELVKPVTREEIRVAAFQLGKDKASGPDGYSRAFFF